MEEAATLSGTSWEIRDVKVSVPQDVNADDMEWVCTKQWEVTKNLDAFGLSLTVEAYHKWSNTRIARAVVHGKYQFNRPVAMETFLSEALKPRSFFERMITDVLGFARGVILQKCEEQQMPEICVPMFDFTPLLPAKRIPDWRLN